MLIGNAAVTVHHVRDLPSCGRRDRPRNGTDDEDVAREVLIHGRMREILGVSSEVKLEEGLSRTTKWFRSPS